MLENFKQRIKKFVQNYVDTLGNQQRINNQIILDFNQISQLFKEDNFIPHTGWSISPSLILHILNDIVIHKRKNIIEFGSGTSTIYIGKLLKILNSDAIIYSVESDEIWHNEIRTKLKLYGIEDHVKLIYSPLVKVPKEISYKTQELWYDTNSVKAKIGNEKIDLVLVDGPFGGSSPFARYSALPFLKNQLSNTFSIYLDDIDRVEEREIARKWSKDNFLKNNIYDRYSQLTNNDRFDEAPFKLINLKS